MSIKSILVIFSGDNREIPAIKTSIHLATKFKARLTCLSMSVNPLHLAHFGFGISGAIRETFISEMEDSNNEQAMHAHIKFEHLCREHKIPIISGNIKAAPYGAVFIYESDIIERSVEHHARIADIVIIGRSIRHVNMDYEAIIDKAIFQGGRPVLLAPNKATPTIGEKIAIAWNGSAEASRALAMSMPIIKQAKEVNIITINEDKDKASAQLKDVSNYLKLHDINSKPHQLNLSNKDVAQTLQDAYHHLKLDMLIMGAYTHSKFRQKILGGLTNHIINEAEYCTLLAH